MRGLQRLKRYAIDGFFILLPIALIVFLFAEMLDLFETIADVLAQLAPRTMILGVDVSHWIALFLLFTVAVLLGVLSHTRLGKRAGAVIQTRMLNRIPAYSIMRDLSRQFAGFRENARFSPAVVEMPMDARVLAFIVEELDDGDYVVLVPTAPTPMVGQVQHVPRERVTPLRVPMARAVNCITSWGIGAAPLFKTDSFERT